jgi:hypothetical protein
MKELPPHLKMNSRCCFYKEPPRGTFDTLPGLKEEPTQALLQTSVTTSTQAIKTASKTTVTQNKGGLIYSREKQKTLPHALPREDGEDTLKLKIPLYS